MWLRSADRGTTMLAAATAAQAAISFVVLGLPAIGPQLREQFDLSLPGLGLLIAAIPLGSGVSFIAAGLAVDRLGTRSATMAGTGVAVAGLVVAAFADGVTQLYAGLFTAGIGSAIVPIAGAAAIFRNYGPGRLAWALGVRQMAVPLGGLVAAITVPALEHVGGTGLVLGIGAGLVAVIGVTLSAVSDSERVRYDASIRAFRGIWEGRALGRLVVVTVLYMFALQSVLVYAVPAARAAGFSAFEAGVVYFTINATAIVSRVAWGRIADRGSGARRIRTLIDVGVVAGVGAGLFGLTLHGGLPLLVAAALVFGFAAMGWNAIVYAIAGEWAHPTLVGRSFSVMATLVFVLSAVVSPVIGGLAAWLGWDALWAIMAVIGLMGAVVARSIPDGSAAPARG